MIFHLISTKHGQVIKSKGSGRLHKKAHELQCKGKGMGVGEGVRENAGERKGKRERKKERKRE